MLRRIAAFFLAATACAAGEVDFAAPVHGYSTKPARDRFSMLKADLESGRVAIDRTSEKAAVASVLGALGVPVSSQMLVFSATSLQLRLISARNPRAIFFNEDTYVGWVPGGKIEVIGIDPELGAVFHIFDVPRGDVPVRAERSDRCMNCHIAPQTGHAPGIIIESVVPGLSGSGISAYRRDQSGHQIPYADRFGGWLVGGRHGIGKHHGNILLDVTPDYRREVAVKAGEFFAIDRYPAATSDILAHLLHEHQAGFANRVISATYRTRELAGKPDAAAQIDALARSIVRYALFAEEPPLPAGGVEPDAGFRTAFLATRKATATGASLKDLDLRTRLLRHRCSYMVYSAPFAGMPEPLKTRVFARLRASLGENAVADSAHLPNAERRAIREILKETLAGF